MIAKALDINNSVSSKAFFSLTPGYRRSYAKSITKKINIKPKIKL